MNEMRDSDPASGDVDLEEILRHAKARPRPRAAARARAYEVLHKEWQVGSRQRRWRRSASVSAIAATLVLAIIAGTLWMDTGSPPAEFVELEVMRASGGHVYHNSRQLSAQALAGADLTLQRGDELATNEATRIALGWDGASLRLDESTRIRFADASTIALLHGAVYFDSTPFGAAVPAAPDLKIDTALGRVSHLGTQFQVGAADDLLRVGVREGKVRVSGQRIDVTLFAGEGMALAASGRFERRAVAAYDSTWQWATDIAPELQIEGRTIAEVLDWIARETGREVRFGSDAARAVAASEPRGIAALAPMSALRTIPYMTSLQFSLSGGFIVVDVSDANDH